jgi:hypothetical protein
MNVIKIHKDYPNLTFYPNQGIVKRNDEEIGYISKSTGYKIIQRKAMHRLMYEAFFNVTLTKEQFVNHINRNRTDNKISNLDVRTNQENTQWSINRTGNYKGVSFDKSKNLYKAELKYSTPIPEKVFNDLGNIKIPKKIASNYFLGRFKTEEEGAKLYNNFALYMTQTYDSCNYMLNEIPNYITIRVNIDKVKYKKSEKYTGVYEQKQHINQYKAEIVFDNTILNLGIYSSELKAAKIYNQQALYFNNHLSCCEYPLNNIDPVVEENIYKKILLKKYKIQEEKSPEIHPKKIKPRIVKDTTKETIKTPKKIKPRVKTI